MLTSTLHAMPVSIQSDNVLNGYYVDIRRRGIHHYAIQQENFGTAAPGKGIIAGYYKLTAKEMAVAEALVYGGKMADYKEVFTFFEALRVRRGDRILQTWDRDADRIGEILNTIGHPKTW